jgi:hypothetical protein
MSLRTASHVVVYSGGRVPSSQNRTFILMYEGSKNFRRIQNEEHSDLLRSSRIIKTVKFMSCYVLDMRLELG